jgi:hypothetical protein
MTKRAEKMMYFPELRYVVVTQEMWCLKMVRKNQLDCYAAAFGTFLALYSPSLTVNGGLCCRTMRNLRTSTLSVGSNKAQTEEKTEYVHWNRWLLQIL